MLFSYLCRKIIKDMAKLRIYNDIMTEDEKFWYAWFGQEGVCYKDIDTFASSIPKDDDTIDMRIFCNGGSVVEGWAIYDRLRQSGKKITCIIEGKAASMATIIMLAAPKENRRAYENASLLLHNPWVPCWALGEQLTAKDLENQAEEMRMWQDKMVDAYVERCGCDRQEIQALMDKDIFIDTKKAKELGLIADTLPAVSASGSNHIDKFINRKTKKKMAKEKTIEVKGSLLNKILSKLGINAEGETVAEGGEGNAATNDVKSMELDTSDGQTITVEREEGEPQVGDAASPDGTFEMPDGKTITIKDGVITDIQTDDGGSASTNGGSTEGGTGGAQQPSASANADEVKALKAKVAGLEKECDELKASLASAKKMAKSKDDLRILNAVKMAGGTEKVLGGICSNYQPDARTVNGKVVTEKSSRESDKEAIIAKMRKLKGKGE